MKQTLLLLSGCLLATSAQTAVLPVYDSSVNPIESAFQYIRDQEGFGFTFGAIATPTSAFGTTAAFRIWSFDAARRADATYMLPAAETGGIRVSFRAINQNYFEIASSLRKVALRAANPKEDPDFLLNVNQSSANYQNLLELISDGTVTGAWNWLNQHPRGTAGVAPGRYVADPVAGEFAVHDYDFVINASTTDSLTYIIHGQERTMDPLRYDLWVDGQPVTPNARGTIFENKSGFDPALGFQYFSFTTATQSHEETDFLFDNIYIHTGASVNDGTIAVPTTTIDNLLDSSFDAGSDYYANVVLGWFFAAGDSDWFYSLSMNGAWCYLVSPEPGAYFVYHTGWESWLYADEAAPGFYYDFKTSMWIVWSW